MKNNNYFYTVNNRYYKRGSSNPPKTIEQYPYNYDPIIRYLKTGIKEEDIEKYSGVYSDRMANWNPNKYQEAYHRYLGHQKIENMCYGNANNVEQFLRDYFDNPKLKLIAVIEYCNTATGYNCFCFIRTDE